MTECILGQGRCHGQKEGAEMMSAGSADESSHSVEIKEGGLCPICQAVPLRACHCKLICDGCGYVESCEDNFISTEEQPE